MKFLKSHIAIMAGAVVLGMLIIGYSFGNIPSNKNIETVKATRMNLEERITASGAVKPAQAIDLSFEKGGTIASVRADVGNYVASGEVLVSLENSELQAQRAQAEADFKSQQAKLDDLKNGARPQEVSVAESKLQNAVLAEGDARQALLNAIQDSYTKSDDGIHNKMDEFFTNPDVAPQLAITVTESQLETDLENQRKDLETMLKSWQSALGGLSKDSDLASALRLSKQNLSLLKSFLDKLAVAVDDPYTSLHVLGATQPISVSMKTDVSTVRSTINASIANLSLAEQGLNSAQSNLTTARENLDLVNAGSTADQIAAQQAQVDKAKANIAYYDSQIAQSFIRAPIDGTITRQDAKRGALASPNQSLVALMSTGKYQIEIFVSEADATKINPGEKAVVTLDAYGENVPFDAQVIKIDPAATLVNGTNAYKATLQFSNDDARIKSGMGANVSIAVQMKNNAVAVPSTAILKKNDKTIVLVKNGSADNEREVRTGIEGSNGYVEILSGLNEGDTVEIFGK